MAAWTDGWWAGLLCAAIVSVPAATMGAEVGPPPGKLPIVAGDHPRVFFFRQTESFARGMRMAYDDWDACFGRLLGIMGKALDEEIPGTIPHNIDYFTRFKHRHPDQAVLLHYNGNARDPRFEPEEFFAGHWLYHVGSVILEDVPAEEGETVIRVADPTLYRMNIGRYRDKNDEIGLCELDENGRPNWFHSEQVQLVAADLANKTITVRRGCYGTKPRAFAAGKAYAAAHATEGPWGRRSNLLWFYNYATCCPKDLQDRTCWQVHARDVADRFAPGGELAAFDGLEFDVLAFRHRGGNRPLDCNADGIGDDGVIEGVNLYGLGVIRFLEELRRRMGDDKLILADGQQQDGGQRGFGILNGIESEGFPHLSDHDIEDWSGALNRHAYWAAFSRPPVFNYINHKFVAPGEQPGENYHPKLPWGRHRLSFAAAVFTDAAICYSYVPPRGDSDFPIAVWDEFWAGKKRRLGWLGKPLGPAKTLAVETPNLLASLWQHGSAGTAAVSYPVLLVAPASAEQVARAITVTIDGEDLYFQMTASSDPLAGYPATMARYVKVGLRSLGDLMRPESLSSAMMQLRGEEPRALDRETGASLRWVGPTTLSGTTLPAFAAHPPYKTKKGSVWWSTTVSVHDGLRLHFATGMGERAPGRSDGVVFRVEARPIQTGKGSVTLGPPTVLFQHNQLASQWEVHELRLDEKLEGKNEGKNDGEKESRSFELRFIADAGPNDDATTDHAYWGDVWVGSSAPVRLSHRSAEHGSWVGRTPFSSGFYFRGLKPGTYELEIVFEGRERVVIHDMSLHAAPDARYRRFERGIVLANPSLHPVAFDLAAIAPGVRFRRISGTSGQDTETNNGQPIGPTVALPPLDALFLEVAED
ncbi:MAG: hypothetical protein GYA33_04815 [Thermogutta sp.]|nr:hypothetical protein [Thermogutta sp.]